MQLFNRSSEYSSSYEEKRLNLISGFLTDNSEKTDENTASLLNMLAESLAFSKLQALLPDSSLSHQPSSSKRNNAGKKSFFKLTKKDLNQMAEYYRNIFALGDKIVSYRQKKNGVYEARYHRNGIDVEVSSKDLAVLKQKFIDALNNLAANGSVKAKSYYTVRFNDFARSC